MIFVDRNRVAPPNILLEHHARELVRLRDWFAQPEDQRAQTDPPLIMPHEVASATRHSLAALFHNKCAFCERRGVSTEQFRPKRRASRAGRIDRDHYWWLASDWNNLYFCCYECNRRKANLFPIEGPPAAAEATGDALLAEKPLLLDPCRDDPEQHLQFLANGRVDALTPHGAATVKVFGLDNDDLVEDRRLTAEWAMAACERLWTSTDRPPASEKRFVEAAFFGAPPWASHRAVVRAVARDFFRARTGPTSAPAVTATSTQMVVTTDAVAALPVSIWLNRIDIENFRSVTRLQLEFPRPEEGKEDEGQPWLMLLGENGVGKSSVMQAIALAMMPDADRDAEGRADGWLTKDASRGHVRLTFTNNTMRQLVFEAGQPTFKATGPIPTMPVLAYGSTRLLPDRRNPVARDIAAVSVRNLFDHMCPLMDAENYLCDTDKVSDDRFNLLITDLKKFLPMRGLGDFHRTKSGLRTMVANHSALLTELSDGYKSVLAMVMDIMLHLTRSSFDMEAAQGLVMIDELELHLHPRWKIRIVEQLRTLFPRVRFIASTHDPLCVHGLRKKELYLLAWNPVSKQFVYEAFDVPPGTRADDVLTGPWFGLPTTMDADTIELMTEHSMLLQHPQRNEVQEQRLHLLYNILAHRMGNFRDTAAQRAALIGAAVPERTMHDERLDGMLQAYLGKILESTSDAGGDDHA